MLRFLREVPEVAELIEHGQGDPAPRAPRLPRALPISRAPTLYIFLEASATSRFAGHKKAHSWAGSVDAYCDRRYGRGKSMVGITIAAM